MLAGALARDGANHMDDERRDGDDMGTVLREGGRWGLRFRRRLAHPVSTVWRAITESEHLRHWMPTDVVGERRTGAAIELPFWREFVEKYRLYQQKTMRGRIRAWEPPRLFEWTWDIDALRFELEAVGDRTTLTFTTWLGGQDPETASKSAAGYHACLARLAELLDTGSIESPLIEADPKDWERKYARAVNEAQSV